MMNPSKMMETWLNLMTEATRGSNDARETMRALTGTSLAPDEMMRLMTRFLPPGIAPTQARVMNESLEEYWRMMGVVPRYRYLEALERNEQLRRQLEEAERALQQMHSGPAAASQEQARKVVDLWGSMLQQTLSAQQEMMRTWAAHSDAQKALPAEGEQKPDQAG